MDATDATSAAVGLRGGRAGAGESAPCGGAGLVCGLGVCVRARACGCVRVFGCCACECVCGRLGLRTLCGPPAGRLPGPCPRRPVSGVPPEHGCGRARAQPGVAVALAGGCRVTAHSDAQALAVPAGRDP